MSIKLAIAAAIGAVVLGLAILLKVQSAAIAARDRELGAMAESLNTVAGENANLAEINRRQRQAADLNARISIETARAFEASSTELARMKRESRHAAAPLPPNCPVVAPSLDLFADRIGELARGMREGAAGGDQQGRNGDHPAAGRAHAMPPAAAPAAAPALRK